MKGAFVATVAVLLSGCGTIYNFAGGDPDIYGGVQNDLGLVLTPGSLGASGALGTSGTTVGCGNGKVFLVGFVLADVALSAAADTLTLPLAVYLRQNEHPKPLGAVHPVGNGTAGEATSPGAPAGPLDRLSPLDWGDGGGPAAQHRDRGPAPQDETWPPSPG
jgi:hypothetical protein